MRWIVDAGKNKMLDRLVGQILQINTVYKFLALLVLLILLPIGALWAGTGINILPALVTNDSGADVSDAQVPFIVSSQLLVDRNFIASTALNTDVHDGDNPVPFMPGTSRTRVLACFNNAGTDQTAACNNATTGDVTLPATGSQTFEIAGENQFNSVWINVSTVTNNVWTITWEYYNGTSYVALASVSDQTTAFTAPGLHAVTWAFPAEDLWPKATLHSIAGSWVRARVSAFTSGTTPPLGQQVYYETGRWWTFVQTMPEDEQRRFNLHLNTTATASVTGTFTVSIGADDGEISSGQIVAGPWPPAFSSIDMTDTTLTPAKQRDALNRFLSRDAYVRFNTASLPDHVQLDTATLACHVSSRSDANNRGMAGQWHLWDTALSSLDYDATSDDNALAAVDITSIIPGGVNTWTLQNLEYINRTGYTGIRLSITGGQPTGVNAVDLAAFESSNPECVLSVVYDGVLSYHSYFPHPDGISVADAAGLELGANDFLIEVAGYIQTDAGLGKNIILKTGSVDITVSATASGVINAVFEQGTSATFDVAADGDDGSVTSAANAVYADVVCSTADATDTNSLAQKLVSGGNFSIHEGLIRLDTSSIPDGATITSATLALDMFSLLNDNARNFTVEYYDFGAAMTCADWTHDAVSDAGSFAIAGLSEGAVNTLTLTGLGSINKTGFTGFRTHIDGGEPTGNNRVFWATREHASKAAPRLTVNYGSAALTLQATGVTTGYHTLTVQSTGTAARLEVDGIIKATGTYTDAITDNANPWQMFLNRVMPYVTFVKITVGGTQDLWYQINDLPDHQLDDRSSSGNNTTARYPDTDGDFTSRLLSIEAVDVIAEDEAEISAEFSGTIPSLTNLTPGEHLETPTFALFIFLKWVSDNGGGTMPYRALLMMFAFLLCIGALMVSWLALHSVHVSLFALAFASISFVFVGAGVWGWAVPLSTTITALFYVFWRRAAV